MPRIPRVDVGNEIYHVLNRANARMPIFFAAQDYRLFEGILGEAKKKYDMRILAYCLMPNHFHLVLYPHKDGDLQRFMQWVTLTHTQRWHATNKTAGTGHLYQGRYKSFLIEGDSHLLTVIRYVERNPLRAKLVAKAEDWEFSSLSKRLQNTAGGFLASWPLPEPDDYLAFVDEPLTEEEVEAVRLSVNRGKPFGTGAWRDEKIEQHGLLATIRKRGRQSKGT